MKCTNTKCRKLAQTIVIDSRTSEKTNKVRRRRLCEACGQRFTTFEIAMDELSDFESEKEQLKVLQDYFEAIAKGLPPVKLKTRIDF